MADVDDVLSSAMIETEREIAAEAWDKESTPLDNDGDHSIEDMGDGLEGQHEPDDDESEEGDESEGEDGQEDEAEEGEEAVEAKKDGDKPADDAVADDKPADAEPEPQGRVPSGRLREQRERADKAEAELKALREQQDRERSDFNRRFDELRTLVQQRQEPPKAAEQPKPEVMPDIFEDPVGYNAYRDRKRDEATAQLRREMDDWRVNFSLNSARKQHGEVFQKAFETLTSLDPRDPENRALVQRIKGSFDPGEEVVTWHRRNETLREVGEDPAAYKERVAKETRDALMKDPDFRKQLLDDLRGEAGTSNNGRPNTVTRLPKSLNGVAGGSRESAPAGAFDGSEQAIADSAWR